MIKLITPLTNEIENSVGFKILNRRHCEMLSELIYIKTGESISYKTIKSALQGNLKIIVWDKPKKHFEKKEKIG